jgi:hypothetical protein
MGGKSRKAGGVSRKLIAHIKSGGSMTTKKKKCVSNKYTTDEEQTKNKTKPLFGSSEDV